MVALTPPPARSVALARARHLGNGVLFVGLSAGQVACWFIWPLPTLAAVVGLAAVSVGISLLFP